MTEHNRIVDEMKDSQWSFESKYQFSEALIRVRHVVQPGSIVYIFSDFHSFNEECRKQMFQLASDIITIDRSDRYMPSIWEDAHIEFRFALNNNEFFAYDNFDIDPIKREMGQWMRKHLSLRL